MMCRKTNGNNFFLFFLFSFFLNLTVFENSGFKRTLCGSKWDPVNGITGNNNAFKYIGTSTVRYGCCPANTYMSAPERSGTFIEANSCSLCPVGTFTSVPNDEISCQLCERGKSSNAGSTSCDLTTIKLPNGNGKHLAADRVGNTLERIVDDILGTDTSKKEIATKKYGPIENWDVSDVTDISWLFYQKGTMKADLSSWDVSRVTTMAYSM